MDRYNRTLKLFDLGLADSPLSFDSPSWEDFTCAVEVELENRDYQIEYFSISAENRATLEICYINQVKIGPKYLRFMIMTKADEPSVVYLISANYLKPLSVRDPIHIIDEIVRLADLHLKPNS